MAYGLQIFNENDQTLIDTNLASQMQVAAIGSIAGRQLLSSGPPPTYSYSSITKQPTELICFNLSVYGTTGINQSYGSSDMYNLSSDAVNFAKLSVVAEITGGATTSADYGITIFNPSSTVSFTDAFDKSYDLLAVHPAGTLDGAGAVVYSGSDFSNIYVGGGTPRVDGNSRINNYGFDTANNQILYYNYLNAGFLGTFSFYNPSNVFVARLRNLT